MSHPTPSYAALLASFQQADTTLRQSSPLFQSLPLPAPSPPLAAILSTGKSAPPPAPHYPPHTVKPPRSYTTLRNPKGSTPAIPYATKKRNAELLEIKAAEDAVTAARQVQQISTVRGDLRVKSVSRQLKEQADALLDRAEQSATETAALQQTNTYHTDILREIAGYDPNELQDPAKPVFRPKAGTRPNKQRSKLSRCHTVAHLVANREEASREQLRQWEQTHQEVDAELSEKTGIRHVDYVHRPCPTPLPFVPPEGPEEERRRTYGLPTLQEETRAALESHLDNPPPAPVTRDKMLVHNRYIPVVTSIVLPETSWEMVTETTPLPTPSQVFDRDSTEYHLLATRREFENALNHLRFTNQWNALEDTLTYLVQEAAL